MLLTSAYQNLIIPKQRAQSISGTIVNVLTALGVMKEGVREILLFIRFSRSEFSTIRAQDQGWVVICTATWQATVSIRSPSSLLIAFLGSCPPPWSLVISPSPRAPSSLQLHTQVPPPLAKSPPIVPAPTQRRQAQERWSVSVHAIT